MEFLSQVSCHLTPDFSRYSQDRKGVESLGDLQNLFRDTFQHNPRRMENTPRDLPLHS